MVLLLRDCMCSGSDNIEHSPQDLIDPLHLWKDQKILRHIVYWWQMNTRLLDNALRLAWATIVAAIIKRAYNAK